MSLQFFAPAGVKSARHKKERDDGDENKINHRFCLQIADLGARLCAKHQPQHVDKVCGIRQIPAGWLCIAAAAGLRHSRAPGAELKCAG
jgi:hypothetical protein